MKKAKDLRKKNEGKVYNKKKKQMKSLENLKMKIQHIHMVRQKYKRNNV